MISISTILIVLLILMLLGALPTWGHSRNWGYGPSGGLGLIAIILIVLLLTHRMAFKLHRQGKSNWEVKKVLGLANSIEACRMIEVGKRQHRIEDSRLTDRELAVIRALARSERARQGNGDISAFNGKWLGGMGWKVGAMLRIIRKRLGRARKGEEDLQLHEMTGLGLIDHWHGGGIRLTRAGWALVHAIEGSAAA